MSKLIVEVCTIDALENLANADKLVMATVKGWNCLVGKDCHTVGELVIFVPPDAIIPDELIVSQNLTFLKEGKGRVKTLKLRGYISQGLILPHSLTPNARLGEDVAERLKIRKYEPIQNVPGVHSSAKSLATKLGELFEGLRVGKLGFKSYIVKSYQCIKSEFSHKKLANTNFKVYTDLDNIKHYPDVFEEGEEVVITEKIHGTNFRTGVLPKPNTWWANLINIFSPEKYEYVYGSHRVQKTPLSGKGFYGEDVYGQIAERYNLKDLIPEDYTLYGEIYGPKIQQLKYGVNAIEVVFFDVKKDDKYLDWDEFVLFCHSRNLPIVPILYRGPLVKADLKQYIEGKTVLGKGCHIREGCVIKPVKEANHPRCGRKILKCINPEYLLLKDDAGIPVDENTEYTH